MPAKFAAAGKAVAKKDLALQAIAYGNVYVARVAMGADPHQTLTALREAEAYDGPSLVIAYSHCIAHGIEMSKGLDQQYRAVASGHWPLVRYDPAVRASGGNPFQLDSPRPRIPLEDYVYNELRYRMLRNADPAEAEQWFTEFDGAGLDGVIAKPLGATYQQNARTMLKIKHARTADVVLCGYREHKTSTPENPLLGSLLLGLYGDGKLQHIGVSASFTAVRRAELIAELQPLVCPIEEHPWGEWAEMAIANPDRVPGTQSRWSAGKDLAFTPLRPDLVLEVKYDHMEGRRFRHTAHFKRWRPDRDPESCGYDQLEEPVSYDLGGILGLGSVRRTNGGKS